MSDAAGWSTWGKPILATIVTSVIVYLQITFFTLAASYMMNRSIYRSGAIRVMTGILAGLTALVTFWVVLFLPKTHYFGMFPVLGPLAADSDRQWGILNYFRSSYNPTDHAGIVEELVRSSLGWRKDGANWVNTSGAKPVEYPITGGLPDPALVVDEARGQAARDAGAKAKATEWAAAMSSIGGLVAAAASVTRAVRGSPSADAAASVTRAVRGSPSADAASRETDYWFELPNPLGQFYYYHDSGKYNRRLWNDIASNRSRDTGYVDGLVSDIVNKFTEVQGEGPPSANIETLRKYIDYHKDKPELRFH